MKRPTKKQVAKANAQLEQAEKVLALETAYDFYDILQKDCDEEERADILESEINFASYFFLGFTELDNIDSFKQKVLDYYQQLFGVFERSRLQK